MTDFIKSPPTPKGGATANNLFGTTTVFKPVVAPPLGAGGLIFSDQATAVFDAGRELWKYYHLQKDVDVNASLYDIREYFQGRNEKGKMNNKSQDTQYMVLINSLRDSLKALARKIEPKVYEYGFLKE